MLSRAAPWRRPGLCYYYYNYTSTPYVTVCTLTLSYNSLFIPKLDTPDIKHHCTKSFRSSQPSFSGTIAALVFTETAPKYLHKLSTSIVSPFTRTSLHIIITLKFFTFPLNFLPSHTLISSVTKGGDVSLTQPPSPYRLRKVVY